MALVRPRNTWQFSEFKDTEIRTNNVAGAYWAVPPRNSLKPEILTSPGSPFLSGDKQSHT
jgi:hypothetical protein